MIKISMQHSDFGLTFFGYVREMAAPKPLIETQNNKERQGESKRKVGESR